MVFDKIPDEIDFSQQCLVEYWSKELHVSHDALRHAAAAVGNRVAKIKKQLEDGFRIALTDDDGLERLVVRLRPQDGGKGFSVLVPYLAIEDGLIHRIPYDYGNTTSVQPLEKENSFRVSRPAKLSFHPNGFVQFSSGDSNLPIVSGFNHELAIPKGVGLKAPVAFNVQSGPLFGIILQGLRGFEMRTKSLAEIFGKQDLWYHPDFTKPSDTAFNLEFFMLSREDVLRSRIDNGKRLLTKYLPFRSKIKFPFTLRVLEFPALPFGLGLIVSRIQHDDSLTGSGYKICGPACFDAREKKFFGITAWYPFPKMLDSLIDKSLDYDKKQPPDKGDTRPDVPA